MKIAHKGLIITAMLVLSVYVAMLLNTNSVVNEVKNVMLGNAKTKMTDNTPLSRYNFSDILSNAEVKVKITRLFVLHNFFDGYIWVNYSYETVKNDNDLTPASSDVLSRWKIHKMNGGDWQIVEIKEAP